MLWQCSDSLPLGGDLSLVLLIEIIPGYWNLNTVTAYLQICLYGIEKIAVVGFFLLPPLLHNTASFQCMYIFAGGGGVGCTSYK